MNDSERLEKIKRIVKNIRKKDNKIIKEEPCCAENIEGEKNYCLFHLLLRRLERALK